MIQHEVLAFADQYGSPMAVDHIGHAFRCDPNECNALLRVARLRSVLDLDKRDPEAMVANALVQALGIAAVVEESMRTTAAELGGEAGVRVVAMSFTKQLFRDTQPGAVAMAIETHLALTSALTEAMKDDGGGHRTALEAVHVLVDARLRYSTTVHSKLDHPASLTEGAMDIWCEADAALGMLANFGLYQAQHIEAARGTNN